MRAQSPGAWSLILAGLILAGNARAAKLSDLLGNSPFVPAGVSAAAAGDTAQALQFRGVVAEAGSYRFSLYDPARKIGAWVRLDETDQGFVVKSFDPASDRVTVAYEGRVLTLALPEAKIGVAPVAATLAGAPPAGPAVPQVNAAEEARRLERIAAEVRRRQLLREQQMQGMVPARH